jgi:hypothetical protein
MILELCPCGERTLIREFSRIREDSRLRSRSLLSRRRDVWPKCEILPWSGQWHVFGSLNAGEAREELDAQVYSSLRSEKKSMLKIVRSANADFVLFTLSGYIDTGHIPELQLAFDGEALPVVLDLREVKRVDREVVADLARWNADSIKFENCPAYLREWIARTQNDPR